MSTVISQVTIPKTCIFDGVALVYDEDGSASGWGFECWYCPECGYVIPV